jgi:hypothetical protein
MSYSSAHWLVRVLHRILLSANSFARRSIQRWLYVWAILTRQSRRQRPSNDERPFPSSNVETIHYELSGIDDSCGSIPVYPSAQPRPRSPSSNTQGTPGLPGLTTSPAFILQAHLHGRHSASQSMHELGATSQTRYSPDNSSVSSRQSAISLAPPSITRRGRNQGRSSLLRPYSYGGRSASRSLQDLETVSRHNYSLNNFSTASRHRSHSSRAPSPVASSTRSSDTGSYHISIDPGSPLSEYSAASQDDFPNVAIPAGDVALPESGEASVLTGKLYQTTPEWILRYERGVYMYVTVTATWTRSLNIFLRPMTESQYRIQPLQTIFPQ